MSVQAISRFFNLGLDSWVATGVEQPNPSQIEIDGLALIDEAVVAKAILSTYDIRKDDAALRKNVQLFEKIRGDYPLRREYPAYTLKLTNVSEKAMNILTNLGFRLDHN